MLLLDYGNPGMGSNEYIEDEKNQKIYPFKSGSAVLENNSSPIKMIMVLPPYDTLS